MLILVIVFFIYTVEIKKSPQSEDLMIFLLNFFITYAQERASWAYGNDASYPCGA